MLNKVNYLNIEQLNVKEMTKKDKNMKKLRKLLEIACQFQ